MIQIVNLTKNFANKSQMPVNVLKKISLNLPDKGLIFMLGKSGSGKTTLLNLLGGLDFFDHGDILINGNSTVNFKQSDFDNYRNGSVGFVFQDFNLIEDLNVMQNLALPLHLQGKKADPVMIKKLLKDFDLDGFELRKVNQLSGGQKQRIAIARSIIKNPSIILADEPTGNLDSKTGKQVLEIFKKLSADKLVIIVSHDAESAYRYGQRVIELQDGKVLSDLSKNNVSPSPQQGFNPKSFKIGQKITPEILLQMQNQNQNDFKASFIATNQVANDNTHEHREMIKIGSYLPLKLAFKMGMSYFKEKKIALIFFLLISALMLYCQIFTNAAFFGVKSLKNLQTHAQQLSLQESLKKIDFLDKSIQFFLQFAETTISNGTKNMLYLNLIVFITVFFTVGRFVKQSIQFKKKEIGILRALGARSRDVFKIFFSEGFVIASLISIFAILFFYFIPFRNILIEDVVKKMINFYVVRLENCEQVSIIQKLPSELISIIGKMKDDLISFRENIIFYLHLGIAFLNIVVSTFLIVFISIFYPIYNFARKKPIEVILNR
ncbi:ABC transporter, ATPase component [Candidatus Phytoplasma mali]|uniref:ABC transporter, ATPase component n=1 Tax=Phytoplasma mali (strain AT) TaxID=482235 RepID=B3R036_PHYMT|nr:ATP-binding cassette domain-containing protein [Candidatus Phytoplasma mali]CAP18200.1 ABC transporter, ATPase component [Candidatus Phytoplasma mali]CAP18672.1 ABC transporter, ATPase component [Candidatus Phytoplasma mali]